MTKPALPATGGSYIRDAKGKLTRAASPGANAPEAAPAAPAKPVSAAEPARRSTDVKKPDVKKEA